jgi:hypothetical protein
MDSATARRVSDSFVGTVLAWLLGSWLLQYLVMDTQLQGLGAIVSLAFLGLFLYVWNVPVSREEKPAIPSRQVSVGRAVCEVLTSMWGWAGIAAFAVWLWFVDGKQVHVEPMARAESWSQAVFWGMVALGVAAGVYFGLRRLATLRSQSHPQRADSSDAGPDINPPPPA